MTSSLPYQWLFVRLSRRFSLAFLAALGLYLVVAFPRLVGAISTLNPPVLLEGLAVVLLALAGVLASLWAATAVYRLAPPRPVRWHRTSPSPEPPRLPGGSRALGRYERLGVILAGGGAKGAYQAGSLSAIRDFLAERDALDRVRMVAATSIGAWNACFWLADRIGGDDSLCERWWSRIRLSEVVAPTYYLPGHRNYVLSAAPWRRAFRELFAEDPASRARIERHLEGPDEPGSVRFYLTRTNVERAHLEFSTNRADLTDVDNASGRRRPLVPGDRWLRAETVDDVEEAVFASMDLPPLFQNIRIGDEIFEDGGVIDNLPIYFGTGIEKCDLLFVLPLNASFTAAAEFKSVFKRLERVMTIRQGALERKALKDVYLYNELAALRGRLRDDPPDASSPAEPSGVPPSAAEALREASRRTLAERAERRVHRPVQIFAVCPDEPLLLDTVEFWKTEEAGRAFRTMREHTRYELDKFDFHAPPNWIRVALIGTRGEVRYLEDF